MTWIMYDAIDVDAIPEHAHCVAGYVGGHWPTYTELRRKFPHSHVLSIAVNAEEDAHCLDVERGDAREDQAAAWVRRQHGRGVRKPAIYASVSAMSGIVSTLHAGGINRQTVRLWSAHYTGHPHVCSPHSCGFLYEGTTVDGTQWTDKAHGRDLDESLLHEWFFPPLKSGAHG